MLRLISAVFALFVFGSMTADAAGTQYRDPEGRFNLMVPEGWMAEKPAVSEVALVMASPRANENGGVCFVAAIVAPETKSTSQSEIDATYSQIFTLDYWKASFQQQGMKDVAIDSAGAQDQRGHKVYYVVASAAMGRDGASSKAKFKESVHIIPGSLQIVMCLAKFESYAELSPDFEIVFDSYDPKNGEYIARARPGSPSLLTLYSGARFDGFNRTVSQDTPNLPASGWSGATASFAVAGYGQWEVCDGLNYSGNCRVVAAAQLGERPVRVGSVRRHVGDGGLRAPAGMVSVAAGAGLKAALERIARGR